MKKIALIIPISLVLASCISQCPETTIATIEPMTLSTTAPVYLSPVNSKPIPLPPKIKTINWSASLLPMVQQMLQVDGVDDGSVLLVNTFKNITNGNVQTWKATDDLTYLITYNSSKFQVIGTDKLNAARQTLGLSADDHLESRSKAVGLARYLNAQYVLYSAASGDVKAPMIDLQLILVQTGEIIWSGNSLIQN